MTKRKIRLFATIITLLSFSIEVFAAEFLILGPRALGMGGAHVAAVDDATAVYWNPAAIAGYQEPKFSVPFGIQLVEHNDITDTLSDIDTVLGDYELDDPEIYLDEDKIIQLLELLVKLDDPGTGLMAGGNVGLAICRGNSAFAILDLGYLGAWVDIDLLRVFDVPPAVPYSIANNESRVYVLGIESRELTTSYLMQRGETLIGTNVKYIFGRTYYKSVNIADESNDIDENLEKTSDSDFAFDIGLLHSPRGSRWKIGFVARNINTPSFSYESGEIELEPQARAGIAYKVHENLVVACDLDLTENESMTPGYDSRTLAAGIEKKIGPRQLALRGGLYKNIAESSAGIVFTGGLGIGSGRFKFDIGGGISPGPDELALSFAFSGIF